MAPAAAAMATAPGLRLPGHAAVHALALDPRRLARATAARSTRTTSSSSGRPPPAGRLAAVAVAQSASKLLLVPGHGAFLAADAGASADELALCLALVLERVPADAALRYLTAADEAELLDWDAEKYRQSLAAARAGPTP